MPVSPLLSLQLTSRLSLPLSLRATASTARVSKPRGNPFLHTLVIARGFSPVAIRSLSRGLRILSCYALRMTSHLVIANTYGMRLHFRLPVIASEQSERDNPFFPPVAIRSLRPYITAFLYLINKTGVQKVYLLNSLFFTLFYHPKACFAILFCNFPFQNTKNKILI